MDAATLKVVPAAGIDQSYFKEVALGPRVPSVVTMSDPRGDWASDRACFLPFKCQAGDLKFQQGQRKGRGCRFRFAGVMLSITKGGGKHLGVDV